MNAYFNRFGYYISGTNLEVFREISPIDAYTNQQHDYLVLIALLSEINVDEFVTIYGDSRCIDEINGIEPLDEWTLAARNFIVRQLLPKIPGICLFKKMESTQIIRKLQEGSNKLEIYKNQDLKIQLAEAALAHSMQLAYQRKKNILGRFKNVNRS